MNHITGIFSFLILSVSLAIFAEDTNRSKSLLPNPLIEAGVSAVVNGVNTITGDYVDSAVDLVIPGPEPLTLERSYASSQLGAEVLGNAWRHNHQSWVIIGKEDRSDIKGKKIEILKGRYMELSSRGAFYTNYYTHDTIKKIEFDLRETGGGLTNCCEGSISARSNPKNTKILFNKKTDIIDVLDASGAHLFFDHNEDHKNKDLYSLRKLVKPNRHFFHYEYNDEGKLSEVKLTDDSESIQFSSLNFEIPPKKSLKKNPEIIVTASDGRQVKYDLTKFKDKYLISQVTRPNAPSETYEYDNEKHPLMVRKSRPDNRFTEIEYYLEKSEDVVGERVKVDDGHYYRKYRVKLLKAPVGHDETPIITHHFISTISRPKNDQEWGKHRKGSTKVFDAYNHKTRYIFSEERRLTAIEKYKGTGLYEPYSVEQFIWGGDNTAEPGYLQAIYFKDPVGKVYNARTFAYDDYGNVTHETFFGNITGHSQPLAQDGDSRIPYENGCDRFGKTYFYGGKGPDRISHLMIGESDDSGLGANYTYVEGTELLASKFVTDHGVIKIRNFYEYDKNGILIKTIIDDGSSSDKSNLANVTERRITYVSPRSSVPYGLPESTDEKYLDLNTGSEILLKRTCNEYSIEGYLRKQEVYNADGNLAYTLEWDYDSHGNVIFEKNALGHIIERKYDDNDNLKEEKFLAQKRMLKHEYDFSNRRRFTEEIHEDGTRLLTSFRYDYLGNRTAIIDHFGNETNFTYDEFGRVISTQYPAIPNVEGTLIRTSTSQEYDLGGNVTRSINQCCEATTAVYNVYGKPIEIHYPDNTHEFFEYNLDGTLKKSTAKNGTYTLYEYDCFQRQVQQEIYSPKQELLSSTKSVYNAFHLISSTDASGMITYHHYDGAGRLISTSTADRESIFEYDPLGRLAVTKERYSFDSYRVKRQKYDLLNRVIEEQIEEGKTGKILRLSAYDYDADGNVIRKTVHTQSGEASTFTFYNGSKQIIKEIDPKGNVTHTHYNYSARNAYGQFVLDITKTDALGNQVITTMNALQKPGMIVRKNAMGQVLSKKELFYSGIGDCQCVVETVITPGAPDRQVTTTFSYDALHRLRDIVEGVNTTKQKHTQIRYNSYGQKETIVKPDGTMILHTYDAKGRLSVFSASDDSFAYQYFYDNNDNPIRIVDLKNNTETFRTYNRAGRMEREQLCSGQLLLYEYDSLDRPAQLTLPDGSRVKYIYDAMNLIEIQRFSSNDNSLYSHKYTTYDLSGHVLEMQLAKNAGNETAEFDRLGRMIASKTTGWSEEIDYDPVGNLLELEINDPGTPAQCCYTYDDMYQLKSETGIASHEYVCDSLYNCVSRDGVSRKINSLNQLIQQGDIDFDHDDSGNRISRVENGETVVYHYDALDRLTQVIDQAAKWEYTYDSFNRRISKTSYARVGDAWTVTNTISYLYQGQNEVGVCDASGKIVELRVLGVGKGAEIGAAVALEINDNVYVPIHDHNGNVVNLIDAESGAIVERYRYSAFGEEKIYDEVGHLISVSAVANPWRFSSKRVDQETGFVYFGRRYYDPETSRWTSPDPIGIEGGPNLYAYVLNSPLNHFDLYGLVPQRTGLFNSFRNISFSSIANGISRFIGRIPLMSMIGKGVQGIGRHLVSIPIVEGVIRSAGKFLSGKGLAWNPAYRDEHSTSCFLGKTDHTNGREGIIFGTGILTNSSETMQGANDLSTSLGGQHVDAVCNATHGFNADISECAAQICNIPTNSVAVAVDALRASLKFFDHITYYAHSQGGLIAYRALQQLTSEQRAKISMVTFGSAAIIDRKEFGLASAVNYVSWGDPVPFIADPVGCFKGMYKKDSCVKFLPAHIPLYDHMLASEPYKKVFNQHVVEFKKTFGVRT